MGIPRFGARLKPYAKKGILGTEESPARDSVAVIDGPGLAHYIYYKLCTERNGSTTGFTYTRISSETVKWLDTLSSIGYQVTAILFDGDLPESKRNVRIGRLQGYIDRLHAFKQSVGSGSPILSGQARRSLSPPPFLVFAVVESLLQHSTYAGKTYVVPGEADGFCVAAAKLASEQISVQTIAILSDDADLLVYELPAKTCVIPFRDLTEARTPAGVTWSTEMYWPSEIVKQLHIAEQGLAKPAFYMAQDTHCDLKQACRKVLRSDPIAQPEFSAFADTFDFTSELNEWKITVDDAVRKSLLHVRDSRVSEVICQLQSSATEGGLRMYLPTLMEDPGRATAWKVGADIRSFAYSALLRAFCSDASIQEYRRSGATAASTLLDVAQDQSLDERLEMLAAHIRNIRDWTADDSKLSPLDGWRCLAMQHTLQHLHVEGHPMPMCDDVVHVLANMADHKWHLIHLSAQYQAVYYSLRILRQALAHVSTMSGGIPNAVAKVHDQLASLPRIFEFLEEDKFENVGQAQDVWRGRIGEILSGFGGENQRRKRSRKRKKQDRESGGSKGERVVFAENPFAMLADA